MHGHCYLTWVRASAEKEDEEQGLRKAVWVGSEDQEEPRGAAQQGPAEPESVSHRACRQPPGNIYRERPKRLSESGGFQTMDRDLLVGDEINQQVKISI